MKYKYFLFDWDGCLADTLPIWFNAMKEALSSFDIKAHDKIIKKGFQSWDIFSELGVQDMALFTKKVYEHVEDQLHTVDWNEGVFDLLIEMKKKNIRTAIVSSAEKSKIIPVLKRLNGEDLFDSVIGRREVENTLGRARVVGSSEIVWS